MHDPLTVAFDVKLPLFYRCRKFGGLSKEIGWATYSLATIWHKDPESDHTDDSCGWFMRSRHGRKDILNKIVKSFEFDWDRVFQPNKTEHDDEDGPFQEKTYFCGLFKPDGDPNLSVQGIVLNLFFTAAGVYFESDGRSSWKRARKWMSRHLLDIILFAENPSDSLFDGITRKFEKGCGEAQNPRRREERIQSMASCIYAWILRSERPWYRHPRWHIHHWRIQIHPVQRLWHWLTQRCSVCGKGFAYNESRYGNWAGTQVQHERCLNSQVPVKLSDETAQPTT